MPKSTRKPSAKIHPNDWYESMYRHLKKSPMAARPCGYCMDRFTPSRAQDRDAHFCCRDCREAFHRYGGLPMRILLRPLEAQMLAVVKRILRQTVAEEIAKYRIAEDSASEPIPVAPVKATTRHRRTKKEMMAEVATDIVSAIGRGRPLTIKEIATMIGVDESKIRKPLYVLVEEGTVKSVGSSSGQGEVYGLAEVVNPVSEDGA